MNTSDIFREVCRVFIPELSPQVLAPLVPDHDLQSGEELGAQRALPVLGARHAGLVDARLVVRLQLAPIHPSLAGGTDDFWVFTMSLGSNVFLWRVRSLSLVKFCGFGIGLQSDFDYFKSD